MSYVSPSESGRGRAFDSVFTTQAKEQQNTSRVAGFYDARHAHSNSSVYNAPLHPQNTQPNSGVCNAHFCPQNTQFNRGVCNAPFCRSSRPGPSVFAMSQPSSDESALYGERDCNSDGLLKVFSSQKSDEINKFHRGFAGDTRPTHGSPNRLLASRLGGSQIEREKNERLLNAYDRAGQFRSPPGRFAGLPLHVDDQSLAYRRDQAHKGPLP